MGSKLGMLVDRVSFDVERGKIAEFARATFARDPAHTDRDAAALRGFDNVLATGTHVVVAGHQRDQQAVVRSLGLDLPRVVVGSTRWEYERPLVAGDRLTAVRSVVADETKEGKRGGRLRIVTLETEYLDGDAQCVLRQREVLIERGSA